MITPFLETEKSEEDTGFNYQPKQSYWTANSYVIDLVRGFRRVPRETLIRSVSISDFAEAYENNIDPLKLLRYYEKVGVHRSRTVSMSLKVMFREVCDIVGEHLTEEYGLLQNDISDNILTAMRTQGSIPWTMWPSWIPIRDWVPPRDGPRGWELY